MELRMEYRHFIKSMERVGSRSHDLVAEVRLQFDCGCFFWMLLQIRKMMQ